MTTKQTTEERQEETTDWTGEPLTLVRRHGDTFAYGLLSNITLPSADVHPSVRAAGSAILKAEAERDQLVQRLHARVAQRDQLLRQLAELDEEDDDEAAEELSRFDRRTELIAARVPGAEQAVVDAWATFSATEGACSAEWDQHLRESGREDAEAAVKLIEAGLVKLNALARKDALLARQGIRHNNPQTPSEIDQNFDRGQRQGSLARIIAGADLASEGQQLGLIPLVLAYRSAFSA